MNILVTISDLINFVRFPIVTVKMREVMPWVPLNETEGLYALNNVPALKGLDIQPVVHSAAGVYRVTADGCLELDELATALEPRRERVRMAARNAQIKKGRMPVDSYLIFPTQDLEDCSDESLRRLSVRQRVALALNIRKISDVDSVELKRKKWFGKKDPHPDAPSNFQSRAVPISGLSHAIA